jgi:peptide/nickel transport system substrate-binding protein
LHGRPPLPRGTRRAIAGLDGDRRSGLLDRREFLIRATALGLAAPSALAMAGSAHAQVTAPPVPGGRIVIRMDVRTVGDPRLFDFSERANVLRGLLEYLVEHRTDGTFEGVLLERWTANAEATEYTLHLRPDIRWNTGDPFTAEDVAANLHGWCEADLPGNVMATALSALVDPGTRRASDGAITVIDLLTVRLRLSRPDVTIIPALADYPAAIQHRDLIGTDPLDHGVGTGAYRVARFEPGIRADLVRDDAHRSGRPAALDEVGFLDLGPDPLLWEDAARAGRIHMTAQTVAGVIDRFDALGWVRYGVPTAATVVVRGRQTAQVNGLPLYADLQLRRSIALAVDNAVTLELGIGGRGTVAENHHVCPIQPDYAHLPLQSADRAAALALATEAGLAGFEHELISVDDTFRRTTADAVAAQMIEAGLRVRRKIVTRDDYDANWMTYPFSATDWNHRPLGVQVLALGYRTGAVWNETGFSNAEFDRLLDRAVTIADAGTRIDTMARLQQILQTDGVIVQPFWRSLYRHAQTGIVGAEMQPKQEINPHTLGWATAAQAAASMPDE